MGKRKELTGVILAAGRGARISPFSETFPKPFLPIRNKPIMQYQLECMITLGITEIIIVVGYNKEVIINHFGNGSAFGVNIKYVEQEDTLGLAHAVGKLEKYINNPFMLFLGDIFLSWWLPNK